MNRRIIVALIGGTALVAATGVLIATAKPTGAVFIAGDRPVNEAQVREKLQADGYSSILIMRQGRLIEAMGVKVVAADLVRIAGRRIQEKIRHDPGAISAIAIELARQGRKAKERMAS